MTSIVPGIRGSSRASFVLRIRVPSKRNAGRSEGRPPVARIALSKETSSRVPSPVRTSRALGPTKDASPDTTSTPFPLRSCPTPPTRRSTTDAFQAWGRAPAPGRGPRHPPPPPRPPDRGDEVPRVDEGFPRDAALVEALPAELVPLDEEDPLPELGRADRRGVPSGASLPYPFPCEPAGSVTGVEAARAVPTSAAGGGAGGGPRRGFRPRR